MKFQILTFGCQMNVNDSDWLSRALRTRGFEEAPAGRTEDVSFYIINTCGVREKPEQKLYSLLGRLAELFQRDPNIFAAVGGCVAQQLGAALWSRFPMVRLVFGTDGLAMAPDALERLCREPRLRLSLLDFEESYPEREAAWPGQPEAAPDPRAFVTIMQGCDNYCAYCIVPYVRGRQKSRKSEAILAECRERLDRGAKELTLLGQNVNAYGLDGHGDGVSFAQLLAKVAALPGLERLRFTTSHPKDLAPEVIEAFGRMGALCPQLHLPVQSGSNRILASMGRKYDMARYRSLVLALRKARPDLALTTDLIVGFPGEEEEDFQATLRVMEELRFSGSFSFLYSDRVGTRAQSMPLKVPAEVMAERLERLQDLQDVLTSSHLQGMVGAKTPVLLEGPSKMLKDGQCAWRGRDVYNHVINVDFPLQPEQISNTDEPAASLGLIGKTIVVRIAEAKKHSLFGKPVGVPW